MRAHYYSVALGAIAALSVLGGRPAAAASFTVTPANLPTAINSAANGDTIYVSAGTCSAHVTVNKTLEIRGAQADVPGTAGTRGATETVLANGITIAAAGVQLNGFVIQGGDLIGDLTGAGVYARAATGLMATNNIVQNNKLGFYLNGSGHVVANNLIRNNNLPGGGSGDGFYSDFGLQDSVISGNYFTGNPIGSIVLVGNAKAKVVNNITISDNRMEHDGTLVLLGTSNVSITRTMVCTVANGHALLLGGGNNHISVSESQFYSSQYRGIRISMDGKTGVNKDIRIYNCDIANNRQGGLSVVAGAYQDGPSDVYDRVDDNKVDAECNSWGAITGPTEAGNPGGKGDKISGAADYAPFRKYIPLNAHVGVTLQQTYSNVSTRTYLQVVRITNYGCKAVVGPAYYSLDGFAAHGIQLDNATGAQDDACQPPIGSPWYTFLGSGSSTLLPGQSVIVTLKFTTSPGVTFNTTKIGGTDGTELNPIGRRIFAANFR